MSSHPRAAEPAGRAIRVALVTGGSGFVGSHLVRTLISEGVVVRSLDLRVPAEPVPGVEAVSADLSVPGSVQSALEGVDTVFHLAGNPSGTVSVQDPVFDFESNARVGLNVLEAVRANPAVRLVYLSSAMVYGRVRGSISTESDLCLPFYPYGASKLAAEHLLQAYVQTYGIDASIGRAFVVYGPGEDPKRAGAEVGQFLRWHLNNVPIQVVGDPSAKIRDFVDVADVVAGLIAVARAGEAGSVYNLGSGTATSLEQLIRVIEKVTGRRAEVEVDDTDLTDSYSLVADITRLRGLGYQPRTALEAGVAAVARELGSSPELPQLATVLSAGSK
ncbi:NAD-dependent epimerase/dehydratase family protein [Catenulispora pinisilvae]|uniref:NAD-dependent epimerase/dehydratase family protein n=1 Tax=Catenulispora pinisilvae TaxID=2705253 RepID=UPI001890F9E6|nr:NAD-dependent epimerase/dehydratase family protein [Catenulispora pinisilvae]